MNWIFANPAGLWALLALPVVLAIHFLQEKRRHVRVSTLFLLERIAPQSAAGARFDRLRQSLPLWLQLLMVLVATWLLVEPRRIREDSRQTIVVVLDSSASMRAFRDETLALLTTEAARWANSATFTDWHLLETDGRRGALYAGDDLRRLLAACDDWNPSRGTHSPDSALLVARGLIADAGMVVLVTDRNADVPPGVAMLSAGRPIGNAGFTGAQVEPLDGGGFRWKAMVRNYGAQPVTREWWIDRDDAGTGERTRFALDPGRTAVLAGELPPGDDRVRLAIDSDAFAMDDALPLQTPVDPALSVDFRAGGEGGDALRRMIEALPNTRPGTGERALTIAVLGAAPDGDAILFASPDPPDTPPDPARPAAESGELTDGLNWMGLLTGPPGEVALTDSDEPLVWKGGRPLIFLRRGESAAGRPVRQLVLNWDPANSTAARNPALLVMLHRFVDSLRRDLPELRAGNFDCGQQVRVPGTDLALTAGDAREPFAGRAPDEPGFFEVLAAGEPHLRGAAQFADVREADFAEAAAVDSARSQIRRSALRNSEADPWQPLWLLVLLGCLLGSWMRRSPRAAANRPAVLSPAT